MANHNPEGLPFPVVIPTACCPQNEENTAKQGCWKGFKAY